MQHCTNQRYTISISISELWNNTIYMYMQLWRINERYQMEAGDDLISMSDMMYALFNDNWLGVLTIKLALLSGPPFFPESLIFLRKTQRTSVYINITDNKTIQGQYTYSQIYVHKTVAKISFLIKHYVSTKNFYRLFYTNFKTV